MIKVGIIRGAVVGAAVLGLAAPAAALPNEDTDTAEPGAASAKADSTYIVLLDDDPVVAYDGDTPGLAPTAPPPGEPVDTDAPAVEEYVDHVQAEQDEILGAVGSSPDAKLASYEYAATGFAANLTGAQAEAIRQQPGVKFVVKDTVRQVHTDASPTFLGLTDKAGPWASGLTGENVVVGMIDTGIWPEHPSFADDGSYRPLTQDEFAGQGCDFGNTAFNPNDAPFTCNNKLLAAKSYGRVFHGGTGVGLAPGSYLSARDENGHGSHTTSTAAGNQGVPASVLGAQYGTVSGIAPRARISVYKACWSTSAEAGSCSTGDLVDAIDAAVADGVDVINYSIGGTATGAIAPDDISFLFANDAGIFVAASAGNTGPPAGTVESPAVIPWLTSVGASTQSRDFRGIVALGNGQIFEGVTITGGIGRVPLVDAADLGNALCDPNRPFTGDIRGKMVLCQRGVVARVAKSQAVAENGGVAMLLFNPSLNTLNTDNHYVPSLHVDQVAGAAIRAYIHAAGANATARLTGGRKVYVQGDVMAAFSSRGPNALAADVISPDVSAPGVNILAANTPTALLGAPGQLFQAISGTSMASPHVAGTYALVKQKHPDWTPAMAKSALMTSARQDVVKEDGVTPADPFDMGAGRIQPGGSVTRKGGLFNPGLVYDAGLYDYIGFLCEADPAVVGGSLCDELPARGVPTTAENLNLASIGISDVTGSATVTRRVTNVADRTITWVPSVDEPEGFDVSVVPGRLRLPPGETGTYQVTVTRTDAEYETWSFGALTWSGGGYSVRSPLAVQAREFSAPEQVLGDGTEGSGELSVTFGYSGLYTAAAHGPVAPRLTEGRVVDDPANNFSTALATGVGVTKHEITVPQGTELARFALFDDFTDGADDLDLYVYRGNQLVGASASGTSNEQVDLVAPPPGTYSVYVHGFSTEGPDAAYTLFDWAVPAETDTGALSVTSAPAEAVAGTTGTVAYAWHGLAPGIRYLGAISHTGPDGLLALTRVQITT